LLPFELNLRQRVVVVVSMLTNTASQRSNTFQVVTGVFLHGENTPETVVEFMGAIGLSVSTTSINSAVTSLSGQAAARIWELAHAVPVLDLYDNVDVFLKHQTPTIEGKKNQLLHLTASTLIAMEHGVTFDDLAISDELLDKLGLSTAQAKAERQPPSYLEVAEALARRFPDEPEAGELTRHEEFYAWQFRLDLVMHGPEEYRRFKDDIGEPGHTLLQIPVVKMRAAPMQATNDNQGTLEGNISGLTNQRHQARLGDPTRKGEEGYRSLIGFGLPVHGDLGAGRAVDSAQQHRMIEPERIERYDYALFEPGLLHGEMAVVDAVRRLTLPSAAKEDSCGFLKMIEKLRPKETGLFSRDEGPGFRSMSDTIRHAGTVSRIDCWREQFEQRHPELSFEDHAATMSYDELVVMSREIVKKYLPDYAFEDQRGPIRSSDRDKAFENAKLRDKLWLQYEEIRYFMRHGDIGRVEECLLDWIVIFRSCGKHNYATHMLDILWRLNCVYPERMRSVALLSQARSLTIPSEIHSS
jgi:hypothetical protein